MAKMAWITPAQLPDNYASQAILLPVENEWVACFAGALLLLSEESNWEQIDGITPEEAAEVWFDILNGWLDTR